jgi:hypothetical protein
MPLNQVVERMDFDVERDGKDSVQRVKTCQRLKTLAAYAPRTSVADR